jgi:hypothetical protein
MVYTKRHVGFVDVLLAGASAVLAGVIVWQDFDPRVLVFFAVALGGAELFIMFRWRLSVACNRCGFDPVLYKKAPERAAVRVKEYMAKRKDDPIGVFTPPPKLPMLKRKGAAPTAAPQSPP